MEQSSACKRKKMFNFCMIRYLVPVCSQQLYCVSSIANLMRSVKHFNCELV